MILKRKLKVLHQARRATRVVSVPSVYHILISVESLWPARYVVEGQGLIFNVYIAEGTEEFETVKLPACGV